MANTAWAIRVGVDLDTTDLQTQLNNATKGTKLNLDTAEASTNLGSLKTDFDLTYQMANNLYTMATNAIKAMVDEIYTIDRALVEFKKVSDFRGNDLEQYSKDLTKSGRDVARSTSDMIEAATFFKKSGFTEAESAQLATVAAMYQNIADTEVSSERAAASIVSQIQAYGRGMIEPMHIIDAYNEVANNFAVGTNDLSNGMEIASAGLATYGNSFEETLGMITAGTEIFTGRSSQVARALMTISARIYDEEKGGAAIKALGISLEDERGLRSTYDILGDIAARWNDLSDAERVELQQAVAGTTRAKEFAAIMMNWGHAVDATSTALDSSGSAIKENEAYMGGLEAKTEAIHALFQELSTNVISSDLVSSMLDLAKAFMDIANTPIGEFVTQFGLLAGTLSGLYSMLKAGILSDLALPSLGTVAPYLAGALLLILGIKKGIEAVQDKLKEKADAQLFENVSKEIELSQDKINEYDQTIEDTKKRLDELNKVPFEERTPNINAEISRLEALIAGYESLKKAEEERLNTELLQKLRGTKFADGAEISYNLGLNGLDGLTEYELEQQGLLNQRALLDSLTASYGSFEEAVWGVAKEYAKIDEVFAEFITEGHSVSEVNKELANSGIYIRETSHGWNEEIQHSLELMDGVGREMEKNITNPSTELINKTKDLIRANKDYYDTLTAFPYEELSLEERKFIDQYNDLNKSISIATIGYETLTKAQEAMIEKQEAMAENGDKLSLEGYVNFLKAIEGVDDSNIINIMNYLSSLGLIDLSYTEQELERLILQVDELSDESVDIEVNVNEEEAEEQTEQVMQAMDAVTEKGITVTSSSDAEALIAGLEKVDELITQLNQKQIVITVVSNISAVLSKFNSLKKTMSGLPDRRTISVYATDYASNTLETIRLKLLELKDKSIKVTVNEVAGTKVSAKATGSDYFEGGNVLINDGAPVKGSAAELIVANGEASIYNNGEPIIANLPKGAKIYTAAETQDILSNVKALKDSIPSMSDGNVTQPSAINASNIVYTPSEYYQANTYSIKKNNLESFETWLKERKHLLELDEITQEQYYIDLERMNEEYLKNNKNAQDKYWQYQEEVYKWKKQQVGEENDLLEKQIELEKALGELAKAQTQKILVFKNGRFQYMSDIDAIAEAQRDVDKIKSGYAKGTTSATAGIHLVGENGPELRVLNDGDGIIPTNATKNLLELAKMGTEGISNAINKTKEVMYSFAINNLTLPNVSNAENFLEGLKNYAYQYSYS